MLFHKQHVYLSASKALFELGKGKWAVEVASEKELAPTLELLKAAVLEGELDAAIEAAAAKLKEGFGR